MKYNCIQIKIKTKNNITLNNNKFIELFKLSFGKKTNLIYNKKESYPYLDIINHEIYIEKNIGKLEYKSTEHEIKINLFHPKFLLDNMKRAKKIINNKEYDLEKNIPNKKRNFKIKIKYLDNAINLNFMFAGCSSLISVHNFQNLNTKYLKTMKSLFHGCHSLLNIDDISHLNNINDINKILCSSLKSLPDFSRWDISKVIDMSNLFNGCSSLKYLPDISKWNTNKIELMNGIFQNGIYQMLIIFLECSKDVLQ